MEQLSVSSGPRATGSIDGGRAAVQRGTRWCGVVGSRRGRACTFPLALLLVCAMPRAGAADGGSSRPVVVDAQPAGVGAMQLWSWVQGEMNAGRARFVDTDSCGGEGEGRPRLWLQNPDSPRRPIDWARTDGVRPGIPASQALPKLRDVASALSGIDIAVPGGDLGDASATPSRNTAADWKLPYRHLRLSYGLGGGGGAQGWGLQVDEHFLALGPGEVVRANGSLGAATIVSSTSGRGRHELAPLYFESGGPDGARTIQLRTPAYARSAYARPQPARAGEPLRHRAGAARVTHLTYVEVVGHVPAGAFGPMR